VFKKVICILICILSGLSSEGQDLVIKTSGDTLQCRIRQISGTYLYYSAPGDTIRKDSIRIADIDSYYFSSDVKYLIDPSLKANKEFEKWQFFLAPGVGYLLSKNTPVIPNEFQNYLNQSHYGFTLNGDASWFFSPHWGIGFTGSYFYSRAKTELVGMPVDSTLYSGPLSNDIGLTFVAAGFHYRILSREARRAYELNLSPGYVFYRDMVRITGHDILFTGGGFGVSGSVYIDFFLKKKLGIRTGLVFLYSDIPPYTRRSDSGSQQVDIGPVDHVNLSRLDVFIGIRL
jgi:hypothetical protein